MKKQVASFSVIIVTVLTFFSCNAQNNQNNETQLTKADEAEVIYFHYTRRCMTCNAVENVAREAVTELNNENISFSDYNLDNETGKKNAKNLKASGQSLLIVSGTNKINITNEAFMFARSNPGKLKEIINTKISELMD